jgi:hypothetical protein
MDWRYYGNDLLNRRYQDIDQINANNVSQLKPAWTFHTGEINVAESYEGSPIEVNGTVYVSTGHDTVFALNATTGKRKWETPSWPSHCRRNEPPEPRQIHSLPRVRFRLQKPPVVDRRDSALPSLSGGGLKNYGMPHAGTVRFQNGL